MAPFTFKKSERLTGKKTIERLFADGGSFFIFPFKVFYIPNSEAPHNRILFSVPKRNFKKATDRNLIKRRSKEIYRLNKFSNKDGKKFDVIFVFVGKEILSYSSIEKKLLQALQRFSEI